MSWNATSSFSQVCESIAYLGLVQWSKKVLRVRVEVFRRRISSSSNQRVEACVRVESKSSRCFAIRFKRNSMRTPLVNSLEVSRLFGDGLNEDESWCLSMCPTSGDKSEAKPKGDFSLVISNS